MDASRKGHKTLIVDADPQCNLTALVLQYREIEDMGDFYRDNPNCDLASGLEPVMQGRIKDLAPGDPVATNNDNLYLYCGNLAISEFETQISVALSTSTAIPAIQNIPGSLGHLLRITGEKHEFDYILIDMSPSVGALNQCLLMGSDYFVVPTSPDFFCAQAITSLTNVIPKWSTAIAPFRADNVDYKIPTDPPKFIGFISQKYRPRNGAPARSFQNWIDVIKNRVNTELVPSLIPLSMSISQADFIQYSLNAEPYNLANVADFNSLIARSQECSTPVFALTEAQIQQTGNVLDTMVENRDSFGETFNNLADSIVSICNNT